MSVGVGKTIGSVIVGVLVAVGVGVRVGVTGVLVGIGNGVLVGSCKLLDTSWVITTPTSPSGGRVKVGGRTVAVGNSATSMGVGTAPQLSPTMRIRTGILPRICLI